MGNINYDHIEAYLGTLTQPRDDFLKRLEAYAEQHGVPIVGPDVGRLLQILAGSLRAERVLELGTAIGYSATWIARGVEANGGTVTTIEWWDEMADLAQVNLKEAGLADRVTILRGLAEEIVPTLEGPFDFIFNDVDKVQYPVLLPHLVELLPAGGLLVTDNVLWKGRVATDDPVPQAAAIREYNAKLHGDPRLETVILPLRDGVSVSRRVR